jgi:polysaccharide biosynthesis transport protein
LSSSSITQSPGQPPALSAQLADGASGGMSFKELWLILKRRRRWFGVTAGLVVAAVGLFTLRQRIFYPTYEGSFLLLVTDPLADDRSSSSRLDELALSTPSVDLPNLIQVLTSPMLLQPLAAQQGLPPGALNGRVITRQANADAGGVLQVILQWDNPAQGERILKALSAEYLAFSLRQRQEKLSQGLTFLDEQAPGLQKRVGAIQQELANFRRSNALLVPEDRAKQIEAERADLEAQQRELQLGQAKLQLLQASVRRGQLLSPQFQGGGGGLQAAAGLNLSEALASGAFKNLLQDLTGVERQLAQASGTYRSSAPLVQQLKAQRNKLRPLLQARQLDAVASALNENQGQQAEVQLQLRQLDRMFQLGPDLVKRYDALNQKLEVARENLTSYLKARETFRLEVAQKTLPWQLISPPGFSQRPVKPDVGRNLMLGVLLGLVAGTAAALLRDRLDHVFHRPREVEEALAPPLLGGIPYLPQADNLSIQLMLDQLEPDRRFGLRESLRNLYAALRLLRAGTSLRLLAITSSATAEGKTTAVALLGYTMADLGLKVLLVDGDLRQIKLHQRLGVDNSRGLSELFGETPPPLQELIQWPEANLAVLPGGPRPPDASKLLSSARCSEVINQIRALPGFDLVLFDTPPALDLVDPLLLAEHLDGLLFLVSLGKIDRDLPRQVLRRIETSGVDLLGLITNQATETPTGYGYGYGYGYAPVATVSRSQLVERLPALAAAKGKTRQWLRWLDERR